MTTSVQHRWLVEHRRWEDYFSAGLGLLVILSPALPGAEVSTAIHLSTGLCGVVVVMVALLETMSLRRWEEIIELASGGWLVVSPLVLDYGGALRLSHFVLGGVIAALAILELWQDRRRLAL